MADEKWSGFDIETSTSGTQVPVLFPDGGSPSGFKNARIAIANFFSSLQSQITTNADDIAILEDDVAILQDNSSKILDSAQGATYDFTQNGDSEIEKIYINLDGGSPTVRIGTTLNGEELVSDQVITDQYKKDINFSKGFTATSRTIYVTITGGSVDIAFYNVESIFN